MLKLSLCLCLALIPVLGYAGPVINIVEKNDFSENTGNENNTPSVSISFNGITNYGYTSGATSDSIKFTTQFDAVGVQDSQNQFFYGLLVDATNTSKVSDWVILNISVANQVVSIDGVFDSLSYSNALTTIGNITGVPLGVNASTDMITQSRIFGVAEKPYLQALKFYDANFNQVALPGGLTIQAQSSAVPEPEQWLMFAIGGLLLNKAGRMKFRA